MANEVIISSDFNASATGWSGIGASASRNTVNALAGLADLKVTTVNPYGMVISKPFNVTVGEVYRAKYSYSTNSTGWRLKIGTSQSVYSTELAGTIDLWLNTSAVKQTQSYQFKAEKSGQCFVIFLNSQIGKTIQLDDFELERLVDGGMISNMGVKTETDIIGETIPPGTVPGTTPPKVGGSPVVNPNPVPTPVVSGTSAAGDPASLAARAGQAAIDNPPDWTPPSTGVTQQISTYWYASQSTWMWIILISIAFYFVKKRMF